jgi:hypothetical protein
MRSQPDLCHKATSLINQLEFARNAGWAEHGTATARIVVSIIALTASDRRCDLDRISTTCALSAVFTEELLTKVDSLRSD